MSQSTVEAASEAAVAVDPAVDAAPGSDIVATGTTESYTSETTARVTRRTAIGSAGAIGRRKEAIARVRIAPGTGQWTINGRPLATYFPNRVHQQLVSGPFTLLDAASEFDVIARITGGGITGQAGALRLGVARALIKVDAENRPSLKKAGFLTRDARIKERKKYGLKKARKAPQYSKR